MKELSLNILDIAENSIAAGARNVRIRIRTDRRSNEMVIEVEDDGKGMNAELLRTVSDPFVTTRTTRKVGLGIPLFRQAAEAAGGTLSIESEPGRGTRVTARMELDHIDRQPLGDLGGTMGALLGANPSVDFDLILEHEGKTFELGSKELKELLGEVPIGSPEIVAWVTEYVREHTSDLYGGVNI